MTRFWIPGWQFNAESLLPLLDALGDSPEQILQYDQTRQTRESWLLDQIQTLPDGCQLVGWSLGGMLACELAARTRKVAQVLVMNSNVRFAGAGGLPTTVADNFMARYRRSPEATRKKFAALVDRANAPAFEPMLITTNQVEKLEWLYDIDVAALSLKTDIVVLLAEQDQLVPVESAKAAWHELTVNITTWPGEHSLPLSQTERVSQWVAQHG